jgi:hypothetical protein
MSTRTPTATLEAGSPGVGRQINLRALLASPGLVASLLCWAGAVLLVASAVIHLHLWSTGYQHIPTIGPLFLLQGIAGIVVALAVAVSRHYLVALAGALFAAGTIGGLILSVEVGLFGFKDSFSAPWATDSLVIEIAAFCVLVAASFLGMHHVSESRHSSGPDNR